MISFFVSFFYTLPCWLWLWDEGEKTNFKEVSCFFFKGEIFATCSGGFFKFHKYTCLLPYNWLSQNYTNRSEISTNNTQYQQNKFKLKNIKVFNSLFKYTTLSHSLFKLITQQRSATLAFSIYKISVSISRIFVNSALLTAAPLLCKVSLSKF